MTDTTIPRLRVEHREDVVLIGLDRPDKLNALDEEAVDELHAILTSTSRSPTVLVVHSTTPGIFAAGADVAELKARTSDDALRAINAGVFTRLAQHRWPTIAVVDGPALGGGCELALACDLRVASPRAVFGQPELALGILAGAGGKWRLPQLVGLATARRMLFMGHRLDGQQALEAGLIDELQEPDHVLSSALLMAATMAKQSWRALELTKLALRLHTPDTTAFDLSAQALLFESDDKHARMGAFLKRRAKRS